jgi:hypothetical protein
MSLKNVQTHIALRSLNVTEAPLKSEQKKIEEEDKLDSVSSKV